MNPLEDIRRFWDADAATYDLSPNHRASSPAESAAWAAALERLLPEAPARVLDAGAGTGFLALNAARLGHEVTAIDLSPGMLSALDRSAAHEGLTIGVIEAPAHEPPSGPFDAIIERHLLWTLPDPAGTLTAWRGAAPSGRLILFESVWGAAALPWDAARIRLQEILRRARGLPPEHHAEYDPELRASLPLAGGTPPEVLVELVEAAGWGPARLERLRDIEWARASSLPPLERLVGLQPRIAVTAG